MKSNKGSRQQRPIKRSGSFDSEFCVFEAAEVKSAHFAHSSALDCSMWLKKAFPIIHYAIYGINGIDLTLRPHYSVLILLLFVNGVQI